MCTDAANSTSQLLTVKETARRLGVHTATVYKRIALGDIPAVRLASKGRGAVRVPEDELESWLFGTHNGGEPA